MKSSTHFENSLQRDTWIQKNRYYYDDILQLCQFLIPQDRTVLEIGCGTGNLIGRLPQKQKVGIDVIEPYLESAKQRFSNVAFHLVDAENTSSMTSTFQSRRFDYIVLSDTLSYVHDVQTVLENAAQALESGGRMIVTAYNNLWEPIFFLGSLLGLRSPMRPMNWLDDTDLRNLFELSGLEVVSQGSRLLLPKKIPLISGWVNRYLSKLWPLTVLDCYDYFVLRRFPVQRTEKPSVSIMIPARNEAGTIPSLLKAVPPMAPQVELIFVEGHSKDDTWDVIKNLPTNPEPWLRVKAFQQDGEGKADAVHKGFAAATGDLLMILDADLSVQVSELPRFYRAIMEGRGDFINGSRLVYRLEDDAMRFLNMLGNKVFGKIFSYLLGQTFKDTLCGTKVLWRKDWQSIMGQRSYFGDFDPFGDFELLFGAAKLNLKIISLPIHYKARIYGETNIRRFRHALLLFRMCWIAARRLKFT